MSAFASGFHYPQYLTVGHAAGIGDIQADVTELGPAVRVMLSADYTLRSYGSFPTRPSLTGAQPPEYDGRVIPSGTTMTVLKCEADALVAAGAATLV
jgi:hypothetical protein